MLPSGQRALLHVPPGLSPGLQLPTLVLLCSPLLDVPYAAQMTRLGKLQSLELCFSECSASGFAPLAQLPSLQRLRLSWCEHLPACLSRLTTLTQLFLEASPSKESPQRAVAAMEAALQALTQLRHLALITRKHSNCHLAVALAGLSSLRTLCWLPSPVVPGVYPQLPPGGWLSGLQQLVLPAPMAADGLAALSAATQLTGLALFTFCDALTTQQARVLRWAAAHPRLRQLSLDFSGRHQCATSFLEVADALQHNPALSLEVGSEVAFAKLWAQGPAAPGLEPWEPLGWWVEQQQL